MALHPLILRAPFVFRTYTKPLGYAGDYMIVNQLLEDTRQGASTYFQIVNTIFLQAAVAVAHRNRIAILVVFLTRLAEQTRRDGRPLRILNVGCGPAIEIQRFIETYLDPELLSFEPSGIVLAMGMWQNLVFGAISYVLYCVACGLHANGFAPRDAFIVNSLFLLMAATVSAVFTFFNERARRMLFQLKIEVAAKNILLEKNNKDLSDIKGQMLQQEKMAAIAADSVVGAWTTMHFDLPRAQ